MFKVTILGKEYSLAEKTKILSLIPDEMKKNFYVAKVNNRLRELNYELCYDCDVQLLDLSNYDSMKVYEASLRYLLAYAFHNVYPDYKIRISYNISRSLLVSILKPDDVIADGKLIRSIQKEIERLVSLDLPFVRTLKTKEEAHQFFIENGNEDKDAILKYRKERNCHFNQCGDYENYMYGYLVPSTGYIHKFKMFRYDNQLVVQYPRYEFKGEIPPFIDEPAFSRMLKSSHKWAKLCNAELVSKMNDHISEESETDFINMCETRHNDMIAELGNIISNDIENIRMICIAGPSSSGKTTFSNRLKIELMAHGITPLRLSLDMYYRRREDCPKDEEGNYDFECLESLNLELFNEQMSALINGEEVTLPTFHFETGEITYDKKVRINEKTPIIIEGIHALNEKLTYSIPKHNKFKIFISPQYQINIDNHNPISYTDIRLLRRIVRDKMTRGTSAEGTLAKWSAVRKGEFKYIYPFEEDCDYIYNSALTYELCVLKKHALPALQEIPSDSPYFIMANRLIKFLKYFKDMDEKWIPCNSLLREFIGGSCFHDA